ncbi:hypothetical protein BO71DRAFT_432740 [Aspergillus ellipticus CBS 707.79]|uniref:Uncharacterized protein n=1 Tax=Aspergillus ellipticus CBS 707.79 TaxID=1448320 RepID=A0A319D246_9EURO|nr:hypothetical protein BO71DRAFT_432740 [Aspergillus ellipticus CBS 707.79]
MLDVQDDRYCSSGIGLSYTRGEFDDAVTRMINFKLKDRFTLDDTAKDTLYNLASGHPGVVSSMIYYIYVFRYDINIKKLTTITHEQLSSCDLPPHSSRLLTPHPVYRSFPHTYLSPQAASFLSDMIDKHHLMKWDPTNPGMQECYQNGRVFKKKLVPDGRNYWKREVVDFPSNFHKQ